MRIAKYAFHSLADESPPTLGCRMLVFLARTPFQHRTLKWWLAEQIQAVILPESHVLVERVPVGVYQRLELEVRGAKSRWQFKSVCEDMLID